MITEDYVSFETAKLLKEKGFKGDCIMDYIDNELMNVYDYDYPSMYELENTGDDVIDAPTLQMAMKWLREVHHIHIVANVDVSSPSFFIDINKKDYDGWVSANDDTSMVYSGETIFTKTFRKYEEACEAAIKYCLEHLI